MKIVSLQSGSNGNCIFVEANGVRLLFDAGLTGEKTKERLETVGVDVRSVHGVLISHDHSDHIKGAGVLQRKFDLPIYLTRKTCETAARNRKAPVHLESPRFFKAGDSIRFDNNVVVETLPTPHDGVDGVGFVVDDGTFRFGILTDLGHVFEGLPELVATLDGVLLESNYDLAMLEQGDYPDFLKQRIRGKGGHLSNAEAATLIKSSGKRLQFACIGHLSERNNHPDLALETHRKIWGTSKLKKTHLLLASRYDVTEVFEG